MALAASSFALGAQQKSSGRGRKYKAPPPTSHIEVTVLRAVNGKPIENAAVIFHPMLGDKDQGAMELKTNEDGKSMIEVLPIGDTVLLQVIAPGYQTYGAEYKIDKAEMSFEIKMKRPGEQYSIYKSHDESANAGKPAAPDSAATPARNAPTAAAPASQQTSGASQSQAQPK
jgi:hypothetical protein